MEQIDQPEYTVELLRKHLSGLLNIEEEIALKAWVDAKPENQQLLDRIANDKLLASDIQLYAELWNEDETPDREARILANVNQKIKADQPSLIVKYRKWIAYAAAVVLAIGSFLYLDYSPKKVSQQQHVTTVKDILPGGNRARLTLADGRTINLESTQTGIIVGNGITYLDGSSVAKGDTNGNKNAVQTLVLQTPIGGNYQVVLPDGSEVWLNANTKLTYPSHFAAAERVVQLEGEAYFEIKKQNAGGKSIPFSVKSKGQTVHVLGTEFNVSAYNEEQHMTTTLINGAVNVTNLAANSVNTIAPGQQAILQGAQTNISKVDVSKSIAWKNGRFSFDGKSFEQIMREMARWYNLTIQYEGSVPTDKFIGDAFKTDKLSTVLRFLESSGIQYRIETTSNSAYRLIINNKGRKETTIN